MTNPTFMQSGGEASAAGSKVSKKRGKSIVEVTYPTLEELSKSAVAQSYPGKKGGEIELLGAIVVVPPSLFGKRDTINVTKVCASDQHLHFPDVVKGELVSGPIYHISSSLPLKRSLAIRLPFHAEDRTNFELKLKWKADASDENPNPTWKYISTYHVIKTSKGDLLELMAEELGTFVAVSVLRTEKFEITAQGCLYNSYTNRHINIRFPKKYLDKTVAWELVIWPVHQDKAQHTKNVMYVADCSEFIACSDFLELRSAEYNGELFRRPVTIRVPLPEYLETDQENQVDRADLSVLCKMDNGADDWELIDPAAVKFTKDSVSFDVKRFSVFAIAQSKPGRGKRLQPALPKVYHQNFRTQGDIVTFLSLDKKDWHLWIEAVRGNKDNHVKNRTNQGGINLRYAEYTQEAVEDKPTEFRSRRTFNSVRRSLPDTPLPVTDNIEFCEGQSLVIDIGGDIETVDEENNSSKLPFYFSEKAVENYRVFKIRPTTLEQRELTFTVSISKIDPVDKKLKRIRFQSIAIGLPDVKNYYYVEPEPSPEPEPMEIEVSISSNSVSDEIDKSCSPRRPKKPSTDSQTPMMSNAFLRLTTHTRPRVVLCKEPKVLSGRSLQVLAKQIPEGLTLAVYLNVPDSTITGIGFDALSNGMTLNMVTYKILLAWKRKARPKEKMVEILVSALKDMGRYDVTDVLLRKNEENVELSHNDFL